MKELDDLRLKVEETTDVVKSAIVLIKGLKERLDAAGTDPAKLKELSEELGFSSKALAEAVLANTPQEPPPTPEAA